MKKFTKLIALLLTLAMVLSMLPSAAFGATIVDGKPVDEALVLNKSYDNGVLTLESYVAGTTSVNTSSVTKPCDIVLVLDVSGSMGNEYVTIGQGYVPYRRGYSAASVSLSSYYYKDGDGEYYQVKSIVAEGGFFTALFRYTWLYYEKNGVRYYLYGDQVYQARTPLETPDRNTNPHDINGNEIPAVVNWPFLVFPLTTYTVWTGTLYRIGSERETKLNALKTAVDGFIDSVAANAAENDVEHRISIVKFAGEYPNRQTASSLSEGNTTGRTEVVKNLTSVLVDPAGGDSAYDNVNSLHDAVDKLEASGATYADYGMTKADYVLDPGTNSKARSDSQKVVVLFTDGEPTTGNTFEQTVANRAIGISHDLKEDGVKVYSVGIYDNPGTNMTNYMNYVSSNYPTAQSMTNTGLRASTSYYRRATTASDLNNIFAAIAAEAVISTDSLVGEPYIEFESTPVMRDVISEYFMLPDNYTDGLKAYYVEQTACIDGEPIFGSEKTYLSASDITVDGKTIKVTGFDYDTYYVTTDDTSSGMNKNGVLGRKLVVEVPIVPDPATPIPDELLAQDPNCKVPTNDGSSGILDGEEFVEPFEIPKAPVSTFKIVHCGATTDTALHTTERFLIPDDTFDLTKAVNDGVLYGGTFTDSACTVAASEDATKFVPEAGKTYYMWEVSEEHLMPKNLCAYRPNDSGKYFVENVYLVTAVDRPEYQNVGFAVSADESLKDLSAENVEDDETVELIPLDEIFKKVAVSQSGRATQEYKYCELYQSATTTAATTTRAASLVACHDLKEIDSKPFYSYTEDAPFYFRAFWTTLDGAVVIGPSTRTASYQSATGMSLNVTDEEYQSIVEPVGGLLTTLSSAPLSVASSYSYDATYSAAKVTVPMTALVAQPETPEIPVEPTEYVSVSDNGVSYNAAIIGGKVKLEPFGAAGKIFAGWYADAAYTVPAKLNDVSDGMAVYAKYVSNDYLNVKYTDSILTKKLTLISAIDSRDYAQTGYIISVNGQKRYVNIDSYANSYLLVSAKTLFGSSISKSAPLMIYEMKLSGIAKNSIIKITPFAVGKDGTEILGEERTLVYTGFSIKG